jgi:hypothetical protein
MMSPSERTVQQPRDGSGVLQIAAQLLARSKKTKCRILIHKASRLKVLAALKANDAIF